MSAKTPLVSVVIAFLNEERFLGEAVESVLHQQYTHWELLLVDDGSSDSSSTLAKAYAASYPGKVYYLEHKHHSNQGLSASRNLGIRKSKGDLVAFLDADDVWLPDKLIEQVSYFHHHPQIGMVVEPSSYWYSWENPHHKDITIAIGAPADTVYAPSQLFQFLYPLGKGAAPCPSGLMLTREAICGIHGFEESFTKENQLYEDQAFLNKIYLHEYVYVSAACHNLYRQRAGSIVQQVHEDGHYHKVRQYFLEWFLEYLRQQPALNRPVKEMVRKALQPYHHPNLHYFTVQLPAKLKRTIIRVRNSVSPHA